MNTHQNMEDQLWDYIDGSLKEEEKSFIKKLLETNQEWREKYNELLEVHQLMQGSIELDEPSMRFSQNVMEEIARYQIAPATKTYINKKVIRGIAAFFIISLVGFVVYAFGQANWSSTSESPLGTAINKVNLDYSKLLNNTYTNVFIMVNIVLGLMLLDMYLTKKKKELQSRHQ
jgi:hypothetical protein